MSICQLDICDDSSLIFGITRWPRTSPNSSGAVAVDRADVEIANARPSDQHPSVQVRNSDLRKLNFVGRIGSMGILIDRLILLPLAVCTVLARVAAYRFAGLEFGPTVLLASFLTVS